MHRGIPSLSKEVRVIWPTSSWPSNVRQTQLLACTGRSLVVLTKPSRQDRMSPLEVPCQCSQIGEGPKRSEVGCRIENRAHVRHRAASGNEQRQPRNPESEIHPSSLARLLARLIRLAWYGSASDQSVHERNLRRQFELHQGSNFVLDLEVAGDFCGRQIFAQFGGI